MTIVDIRGDKVRLGIEAPTEIPVHRREVFEAIQRENQHGSRIPSNNPQPLEKRGPARSAPSPLAGWGRWPAQPSGALRETTVA